MGLNTISGTSSKLNLEQKHATVLQALKIRQRKTLTLLLAKLPSNRYFTSFNNKGAFWNVTSIQVSKLQSVAEPTLPILFSCSLPN